MGRLCTVCAHPEQQAIDKALEAGWTFRDIAAQFGVSKAALHRHWHAHISGEGPPPQPSPPQPRSRIWKWALGIILAAAGGAGYVWWTSTAPQPVSGAPGGTVATKSTSPLSQ